MSTYTKLGPSMLRLSSGASDLFEAGLNDSQVASLLRVSRTTTLKLRRHVGAKPLPRNPRAKPVE